MNILISEFHFMQRTNVQTYLQAYSAGECVNLGQHGPIQAYKNNIILKMHQVVSFYKAVHIGVGAHAVSFGGKAFLPENICIKN